MRPARPLHAHFAHLITQQQHRSGGSCSTFGPMQYTLCDHRGERRVHGSVQVVARQRRTQTAHEPHLAHCRGQAVADAAAAAAAAGSSSGSRHAAPERALYTCTYLSDTRGAYATAAPAP
eukprot:TRINITY_DN1231_c0_g1_i1.p2 TRINITY_DN1231_c0_g1~~TRINITY_DN1231_c0_g1_i1.p2  ORF type:complete len:120 (+),score=26.05 TRINITY_DN1231_c0_g1_i1:168-527(+)